MSFYESSQYHVPTALEDVHQKQFAALGEPGTWYTGAQRLAIAAEARAACCTAGFQDSDGGSDALRDAAELTPVTRRVTSQLAANPQAFEHPLYQQAIEEGLTDAEWVEIVGLVSRITNFDMFARGIGAEVAPLPAAQPGEPDRQRPDNATEEGAWVPSIPNGKRGGAIGLELYGDRFLPFLFRAMSLIPAELRTHIELETAQYMPLDRFFDFSYQHHEGLTRAQVEVIAGRVSAINECFY